MTYDVNVESIAQDISDEVKESILNRLSTYNFPYVSTIPNKNALREVFKEYFTKRKDFDWLKNEISKLVTNKRGIVPTAMTESNRLHTGGLGDLLLKKGQTRCMTIHSYGDTSKIDYKCLKHIHNGELEINIILQNSFPDSVDGLREDVPMIPQHVNCRHVMSPLD